MSPPIRKWTIKRMFFAVVIYTISCRLWFHSRRVPLCCLFWYNMYYIGYSTTVICYSRCSWIDLNSLYTNNEHNLSSHLYMHKAIRRSCTFITKKKCVNHIFHSKQNPLYIKTKKKLSLLLYFITFICWLFTINTGDIQGN